MSKKFTRDPEQQNLSLAEFEFLLNQTPERAEEALRNKLIYGVLK